jgi:hypothetical protein
VKNVGLVLGKACLEMLWWVFFRVDKVKVELQKSNEWRLAEIEAVCLALQVLISEIFKPIKGWSAEEFCEHRPETFRIIALAEILEDLILEYERREAEDNSRRGSLLSKLNFSGGREVLSRSSQSLKIKFCELSRSSL